MDLSGLTHTLGGKITFKAADGGLKIYLKASNRGDKSRIKQLESKLKIYIVFGILLLPLFFIAWHTEYFIYALVALPLYILLLFRVWFATEFLKNGIETLFVRQGQIQYHYVLVLGGNRLTLVDKVLSGPIQLSLSSRQDVGFGLDVLDGHKTRSMFWKELSNGFSVKFDVEQGCGEKLIEIIEEALNNTNPTIQKDWN
jgi:hypothetical protein